MEDLQALQSPIYSQVAGVLDACDTARDDHNAKLQKRRSSPSSRACSRTSVSKRLSILRRNAKRLDTSGNPIDNTMQKSMLTVFASDAAKDLYSAFWRANENTRAVRGVVKE
jgi:hypothetical protein